MNIITVNTSNFLYDPPNISTPLTKKVKVIFADDTASGRPSKKIDGYIMTEILPYYSNTHSNAFCGMMMKDKLDEIRNKIKEFYNLDKENHKVIFSGNGTTSAINHLSNCIDYESHKRINIYLSTYEHYSNYLPWIEISKKNKNVTVYVIPFNGDDEIDYEWLRNKFNENLKENTMNIVTIIACSNVTGVRTDIKKCIDIAKTSEIGDNYLFLDCACIGPYEKLDLNQVDGIFISMHKFVGGTSTPGLLIATKKLFEKSCPYNPGGGCVKRADTHNIIYEDDIEKKEMGGTPNIVGIIRIGYILDFMNEHIEIIEHNEKEITNYVMDKFMELEKKYPQLKLLMRNQNDRLPILSFNIKDMHHNYIVVLLNDLFGIQTRGGISCCGMLAEYMIKKYNISGWCRISFNWMMNKEKIDYILNAVEFILKMAHVFTPLYSYDEESHLYSYSHSEKYNLDSELLLHHK
jgi:selenocysteine lyase/cysteine desulfurase